MRRDYIYVGILWFALAFLGFLLAPTFSDVMLPFLASEEGELIDSAFEFLVIMAIPVVAFVLAVLFYSVVRFRSTADENEEGPHDRGSQTVYLVWLGITSLLAIIITIHPGITGIAELRSNPKADLEIQVVAEKWNWDYIYPDYDLVIENADELVIPVDTRIKFEITSLDILHSFWVPAFRMKTDAVPGMTTVLYITSTETGAFSDESMLRVQCAELCGTGHTRMRNAVVVMDKAEFEAWASSQVQLSGASTASR